MPRARYKTIRKETQTAPLYQEQGSGYFSGFVFVPCIVVTVSFLLSAFIWRTELLSQTSVSNSVQISPIFREEVQHWNDSIIKWSIASGLNPNLIATIMQIETCGDPRATSSAGAMGLFQVMPFHFQPTENAYDPNTNAARGLVYLARSLSAAQGDVRLALAGYNGGIGLLAKPEWNWPAETKRYVHYGAPIYYDAVDDEEASKSLQEWYTAYGVSLCRQAHERLGMP